MSGKGNTKVLNNLSSQEYGDIGKAWFISWKGMIFPFYPKTFSLHFKSWEVAFIQRRRRRRRRWWRRRRRRGRERGGGRLQNKEKVRFTHGELLPQKHFWRNWSPCGSTWYVAHVHKMIAALGKLSKDDWKAELCIVVRSIMSIKSQYLRHRFTLLWK